MQSEHITTTCNMKKNINGIRIRMKNKTLLSLFLILFCCSFSQREEHIELIKSEVAYCKYLIWKIETSQLPAENGLPWVYGILEIIEYQINEIIILDCEA